MHRQWLLTPHTKVISRKDIPDTFSLMAGDIGFKEDTVPAYQQPLFYSAEQCRTVMWGYRKHSRVLRNIAVAKHRGAWDPEALIEMYERCVAILYID